MEVEVVVRSPRASALRSEAPIVDPSYDFLWRWTWADRALSRSAATAALLRVAAGTGLVTIAGSILIVAALVETNDVGVLLANVLAVGGLRSSELQIGDRVVFRPTPRPALCADGDGRSLDPMSVRTLRTRTHSEGKPLAPEPHQKTRELGRFSSSHRVAESKACESLLAPEASDCDQQVEIRTHAVCQR